jgi:hypothetical protein
MSVFVVITYARFMSVFVVTYSRFMSVFVVIQHAKRMLHYIVICGLSGCATSFLHYFKNSVAFGNKLLNIKVCFDYLRKFYLNISYNEKN